MWGQAEKVGDNPTYSRVIEWQDARRIIRRHRLHKTSRPV